MKLSFIASGRPEAQAALAQCQRLYGTHSLEQADVIVALGGDGAMLTALRQQFDGDTPVYGMHRGTIGFLMNDFEVKGLEERVTNAARVRIYPLKMDAIDKDGAPHQQWAINEVSLLRQTAQTARLKLTVDGQERLSELSCDGILVATPAGSTAYNLSAHGPILPISANLLAMTPISPFRPRRWRGALLRNDARVEINVIKPDLRPVSASADNQEVRAVKRVLIQEDRSIKLSLLFDPGHALEERILNEQFAF